MRQAIAELGIEVLGSESLRRHGADEDGAIEVAEDTLLPDFLNSRAATIFGGSQEIQLGIIAKTLLGNPAG